MRGNTTAAPGVNDYDENVKLAKFPVKAEGDDMLVDIP